ncbi:hypothetical protein BU16DRAFT_329055 [Lophium mytilinum]|uniref:WSC domain-containing protein n=1 Tax=Lophium mytilinum TaxID=390894 RepID=A0A6A6R1V2_9PEZI|nr:hypothetical protein BU16DRAFT_329055 [Lophium mytilinum]
MRTTTILSLTLSLLSLGSNASNSSDISEIFPNLGTLPPTGDYSVVYINPDTHKLVEDSIPNVSKRGQSYYEDPLVALLRRNNAYGFCKAYCTGEKPSTVTKTKSATKTVAVSKSTTSCLNKCVPKTTVRTVKGASLAPSIVTTTTTAWLLSSRLVKRQSNLQCLKVNIGLGSSKVYESTPSSDEPVCTDLWPVTVSAFLATPC